jgi:hypothetical protein
VLSVGHLTSCSVLCKYTCPLLLFPVLTRVLTQCPLQVHVSSSTVFCTYTCPHTVVSASTRVFFHGFLYVHVSSRSALCKYTCSLPRFSVLTRVLTQCSLQVHESSSTVSCTYTCAHTVLSASTRVLFHGFLYVHVCSRSALCKYTCPKRAYCVLDHRQTLPTIAELQTNNLQGNTETDMVLWNRAMGMRFTIKYSKNPAIPVQTLKAYNERTLVRYKPNSPPKLLDRGSKICIGWCKKRIF